MFPKDLTGITKQVGLSQEYAHYTGSAKIAI